MAKLISYLLIICKEELNFIILYFYFYISPYKFMQSSLHLGSGET